MTGSRSRTGREVVLFQAERGRLDYITGGRKRSLLPHFGLPISKESAISGSEAGCVMSSQAEGGRNGTRSTFAPL